MLLAELNNATVEFRLKYHIDYHKTKQKSMSIQFVG